ncbi:MAG: hypothetical protein C4527_06220 [Candidatus Omnitrophota bacterium]|jgi:hypothetical protein|nr:MAG: hypothetical protein C4527_06220 [Candidatus Omnitrophota bacterium]
MLPLFSRRNFLGTGVSCLLSATGIRSFSANTATNSAQFNASEVTKSQKKYSFGERRIYYNNFAEHLLNAYNPNMIYPDLPYCWSDEDWRGVIDMIAGFGFNTFEFWLVPRLFSREGLSAKFGDEFTRQMRMIIEYARERNVQTSMLCILTTVGKDWRTYCPNVKEEWEEVRFLWDAWTRRFPDLSLIDIFPGDPGGCSRNGCTAETYIDKSIEIAALIRRNLPKAEIQFNTWGPPFWGWGIFKGPVGWQGEFIQQYQSSGWKLEKRRVERSMNYLLKRLPDFPESTSVFINMGFNSNGDPTGDADARSWVRAIAKTHCIMTWDFSLMEGENAILPHYRFDRLFRRRREERDTASYSGGICFTMTPLLNQLSLYLAAQSFLQPDAEPIEIATQFYFQLFGDTGRMLPDYLPLFEIVPDWGNTQQIQLSRQEFYKKMKQFCELLESLQPVGDGNMALHPGVDRYREELLFFARLFTCLTGPTPDYDQLEREYWRRVYAIYDFLPDHVDPRPKHATANLIRFFKEYR